MTEEQASESLRSIIQLIVEQFKIHGVSYSLNGMTPKTTVGKEQVTMLSKKFKETIAFLPIEEHHWWFSKLRKSVHNFDK